MAQSTAIQLAYLAGLLDGEGCLSIGEQHLNYNCRLLITNTNYAIMDWLAINFGGKVNSRAVPEGHKVQYTWSVTSAEEIERLLHLVSPYLVAKRAHAALLLEFAAYKRSEFRTLDGFKKLKEEMHKLNRKGV